MKNQTISPQHLLYVIISYYPHPSYTGLGRRVDSLRQFLEKNSIRYLIITPENRDSNDIKNHIKMKVIGINPENKFFMTRFVVTLIYWIWAFFILYFILSKAIKTRCIIVIHYIQIFSYIPILLINTFAKKLMKNVFVIADDLTIIQRSNFIVRSIFGALERKAFKQSHILSTACYDKYLKLKALYPTKTYLIPNGAFPFIKNLDKKINNIAMSDAQTVVFVGNPNFWQNRIALKNIIKALNLAKKSSICKKRITVKIIGFNMNNISIGCFDVKFLGRVSDKTLKEIYEKAAIGLLPYFEETPLFGTQRTKTIEYLINGLLVISGPEGIGHSYVDPIANEHYIQANTLHDFGNYIIDVAMNYDKYIKIVKKSYTFAMKNMHWFNIWARFINDILLPKINAFEH